MNACPLCEKLRQPPADEVVWEFPRSLALLGPWQYHTGYCVLVARQHVAELHLMDKSERRESLDEMSTLSQAIAQAYRPRKMNLESLGNQVPHLHWHLFPRRADDPDTLKAAWLAIDRAERDPAERERLSALEISRSDIVLKLREQLEILRTSRV